MKHFNIVFLLQELLNLPENRLHDRLPDTIRDISRGT